jgi:RNA polymerase sigma factor (sigma-70 family)
VRSDINRDLIRACIKNDRKAQEQLYRQFYGPMFSICMRYLGNKDEALEVVNDGYLKIFKNLSKYDEQFASLYTWMSRIMINTAIDAIRKNKQLNFSNVDSLENVVETPLEVPDEYTVQQLVHFINQLPATTRLVFNLHTVEGYSHEEISKFLNITSSTSRWHLSEARKQLRDIIKKHERA